MDQAKADEEWRDLIADCYKKRASQEQLVRLLTAFDNKHAVYRPRKAAGIVLGAGNRRLFVDPRMQLYLRELLHRDWIDIPELLSASLPPKQQDGSHLDPALLDPTNSSKRSLQKIVIHFVTQEMSANIIRTAEELFLILRSLLEWMSLFPASATLAILINTILGSPISQEVLPNVDARGFKIAFGRSLSTLIGNLSQTNIQLAGALDYWQKLFNLQEQLPTESMNLLDGVDLGALNFQESVMDNEPINTRAGLFIYLSAMLSERPLFEDLTVMNYLSIRYRDNIPTLVTDLISASFDILANAMYRNEPPQSNTVLRSFLVNKLPAFLNNYVGLIFPPLSVETCIGQALLRVDPAAFPSISQMFDMVGKNGMLSEARQDFLFACALHELIPESSIEGLLGDIPMQSLPASGRYMKNELVKQCTDNPAKIEELIGELENMEGNAGEIAGALIEIINILCSSNDTMTLKGVCNGLVRRPATLEVIMLFTNLAVFLQPLCHLLDNWQTHEDQGECQPVYDEFGSILLLVVTMKHRFQLNLMDLGILDPKLFTAQYLRTACESKIGNRLTESDNNLLGGWIRGLFETEGISDELMSTCKPSEFHLLVATLFDQSLKACQARILPLENLKSGLECLLEPSLLPCLAAGLTWLAHKIWETKSDSGNLDILMAALQTLLTPSSDSSDTHSVVLVIVAEPLEEALAHAQRQHKIRPDISSMSNKLKQYLQKHRQNTTALTELEGWSSTSRGGLLAALNNTIHLLITWSCGSETAPPSYSHRLLLQAIRTVGAKATLDSLIDFIVVQDSNPQALDAVLDIVVTMIVAPTPQTSIPTTSPLLLSSPQRLLTLRDVLQTEFAQLSETSKRDPARAAMIVRLHRRVETFTAIQQDPSNQLNVSMETNDQQMLLSSAEGIGATELDDVLAETDRQIASGDFSLGAAGDDFMSLD